MANTVNQLGFANTFGDWLVVTNASGTEINSIGKYNWTKDTGALILNGSGTGLQVANNVIVSGMLQVTGVGSSVSIQNNLTVSGSANVSGNVFVSGSVTSVSDARVKTDIKIIPDALNKVMQIGGYTYLRIDTHERQTGVMAQEVLKILPEAVVGSEDTQYGVSYGNMIGLLVEAIKELKTEVDSLKNRE